MGGYFGEWLGSAYAGDWWGDTPSSGRGPFQCGLFQPDVFQNDCEEPGGSPIGSPVEPPPEPEVVVWGGGYRFIFPPSNRARILRDDDDIAALLVSILQSGMLH